MEPHRSVLGPEDTCRRRWSLVNGVALVLVCALSQSLAFTQRMGRATVGSDSYQYIAQAEALIHADGKPDFEMRKPGYPLVLAGVLACFGQLGWIAVVANHVLCGLLPLAAYGLGVRLHSRLFGWIAALLVMVRLQHSPLANLMMSEPLYMFLLSFGLLALVAALQDQRLKATPVMVAGGLLGAAWFTRSAGIAPIVTAAGALATAGAFRMRRRSASSGGWRSVGGARIESNAAEPSRGSKPAARESRAVTAGVRLAMFMLPVIGFAVAEGALNARYSGRFHLSHGAMGANLFTARLCYVQGARPPATDAVTTLQGLLPERRGHDAFRADLNDQWVAMTRAIRDRGWTSSQFDALCLRAGWETIRTDVVGYARTTFALMGEHLMRSGGVQPTTWFSRADRGMLIDSASANPTADELVDWDGRWCLPQLPPEAGVALARKIHTEATQRGPIDRYGILNTLRYVRSRPTVSAGLSWLDSIASLWPGYALFLCVVAGRHRALCLVLATMYVGDALLHGAVAFTDYRYQGVWLVTDTVVAAVVPMAVMTGLHHFARTMPGRGAARCSTSVDPVPAAGWLYGADAPPGRSA